MLSRIASNLYWMGRYLERAEFLARYTRVQYFSTFDAPNLQDKNFVLASIVNMTSIEYDVNEGELDEKEIIRKVGIDKSSEVSIYAYVQSARENARSARHVLSDELWESINEYFIYVSNFSSAYYETRGLYEFTQQINKRSYAIKSSINQTLLHESAWMMINLGMYLERTIQILRTMRSKLIDIETLSENGKNPVLSEYQWTVTLKILEAFDIYRRYFKNFPLGYTQSSFILYHKSFPRSIVYNLNKLVEMANRISARETSMKEVVFQAGSIYSSVKYTKAEEIESLPEFMDQVLEKVYHLNDLISIELFNELDMDDINDIDTQDVDDNSQA